MGDNVDLNKYIIENDIIKIIAKRGNKGDTIESYSVTNASNEMLGFLCDYWKLRVHLTSKETLHYFLKAKSVSNEYKAQTVEELDLLGKESYFYEVIVKSLEIQNLKPWSPGFVTRLETSIVFEDMNAKGYKLRNTFKRFDKAHTLQALKTLARFHASSIIFEDKKSRELGRKYSLNEDFDEHLGTAGYEENDPWYCQCMYGALEGFKKFSKHTEKQIDIIEKRWVETWVSALNLSNASDVHKNVICHRDLWNNNIMFHYGTDDLPDDCILVDFPAARYQPPAGDVMLLLYSNLYPQFREDNLDYFLNFYIEELHQILKDNAVDTDIISKEQFMKSAVEQRKWGIVIWACLLPLAWLTHEELVKYFSDTTQFDYIVTKNKAFFIIEMMESNHDYKEKLMKVFEEIVERYCQ